MPLLPRSDFKIVIRPRGGLDVATTGTVRLASSIYRTANVPAQEAGEDTVCSNNRQNIIVVSAYETAPDYTVKGIIREIPLEEDAKSIHTNIIHGRNPHALAAKRLSNTKTVIVAFEGPLVPSYVRQRAETRIDVYEAGRATKEHGPAGDSRSTCHLETIQE
ncbi:hypothetical protein HPB49_024368 [Dermacentor silvarum]|uniref:Uncharacterized protein n=1 Tax=Dermacentor silvarum TaxID=543639 RepID=A0ACB8CN88_DERSI|nr:hypothetical protein HPB49_024368 [Dermacentor silvarum]